MNLYSNQNKSDNNRWHEYYAALDGKPPRDTLLLALDLFDNDQTGNLIKSAVDLGCGSGSDTLELLRQGWTVLAIDAEEKVIPYLKGYESEYPNQLTVKISKFETIDFSNQANLINASFSLPFCSPEYFPRLWDRIYNSLRPGGRFCGQLFGNRDGWATNTSMTFQTLKQVEDLFRGYELELFNEKEFIGDTALKGQKHWHIFHFVARKI